MKTIMVIARRGREAEDYIRVTQHKYPDTKFIYVWKPEQLYGLKNAECHLIGYYSEHEHWDWIREILRTRGYPCTEVFDWR